MLSLFIAIRFFIRAVRTALLDPEFQSLSLIVSVMLTIGTVFYHQVEGWRWLDSLYFSVITLTTVGYGDFSPKTDMGKAFTMIYIFLGVGLLVAVVSKLARVLIAARENQK